MTRLQGMLEIDHITGKQCTALRKTLHIAYQIISQSVNDIMNVRHDIPVVQNEHNMRCMLNQQKPHRPAVDHDMATAREGALQLKYTTRTRVGGR